MHLPTSTLIWINRRCTMRTCNKDSMKVSFNSFSGKGGVTDKRSFPYCSPCIKEKKSMCNPLIEQIIKKRCTTEHLKKIIWKFHSIPFSSIVGVMDKSLSNISLNGDRSFSFTRPSRYNFCSVLQLQYCSFEGWFISCFWCYWSQHTF